MRSGLLVPVSNNTLGVVTILVILAVIFYAIYWKSNKNSNKEIEDAFNRGDNEIADKIAVELASNESFSILTEQESYFGNKTFSLDRKLLVYYTDGDYSFAIGSHSHSNKQKVFIRVSYEDEPISHKFTISDNNSNVLAKPALSAESLIFATDNIRYYEVTWDEIDLLSISNEYRVNNNGFEKNLCVIESKQLSKAAIFVLLKNSQKPHTFIARNE